MTPSRVLPDFTDEAGDAARIFRIAIDNCKQSFDIGKLYEDYAVKKNSSKINHLRRLKK